MEHIDKGCRDTSVITKLKRMQEFLMVRREANQSVESYVREFREKREKVEKDSLTKAFNEDEKVVPLMLLLNVGLTQIQVSNIFTLEIPSTNGT